MITETIIDLLDNLPEVALNNIKQANSSFHAETLDMPSTRKIFGHDVTISAEQFQIMEINRKSQIITDWQAAKNELRDMLIRENVMPLAIVPTKTFRMILDEMRIISLENMSETGTITVAPRIIDEFLAEMNQREIKFIERLSKEKTQEELLMQYHRFSTQEWCRYDPDLYFIVEGKCSEERPLSSFTYNAKKKNQSEGPLEIFINEHEEFRELLFLDKKINSDFSQYTGINSDDVHESKYFLYKLLLEKTSSVFSNKYFYNSDSQLNPEPFMGFAGAFYEREKSGVVDVVFEKLPEAIQNLLITIKTKFPAWKLFTAADPEFFTLRLENGLTIDEVFHQKKNFWDDFQQKIKLQNDDVVSYLKELIQLKRQVEQQEKEEREAKLLQNHEELKKVFDEKMKQLGLAQRYTKNMIFKTMDDVDHAIWIEKDPFFYTHMNMTFKKVSYPMTIIWGQYGQSHREQIAVEKFKNIDHEVFLGIRSN